MKIKRCLVASALLSGAANFNLHAQDDEEVTDLGIFISEQIAAEESDSLIPTDRTVDSAFFDDMDLVDIPRAITVLSPEAMEQFQINDFDDLQKVGAGTERYNFYGIPGAPVLRGWQGGIYYNGMLRPFQRNEMPTSFGSLEAMEIVKGPAPAQYIPSHVGGYVNMIPKSPFFDESRGSVTLEAGSNDHYNVQVDQGAPFMLGKAPAAYRLSLSVQDADSYWKNVGNDYLSLYAALKVKLSDKTSIFAGAEYYEFESNENAGWNRPTQNLVDNNEYVIGEPLSVVRPGNGGIADRNIVDGLVWGYAPLTNGNYADFRALVVPADIVEAAGLPADQLAALKNMADAEVRAATYAGMPDDVVQTTSGYLYTPEYFLAGGTPFTTTIDADDVLSDLSDFADSEDIMAFFDITHNFDSGSTLTNKLFVEKIDTDKVSSYQYAFRMSQEVVDDRISLTNEIDIGDSMSLLLNYGAQARLTKAKQLQDFWVEPMARRDISLPTISANSVFLSGSDIDPLAGGNNYWGGNFGASGPGGHAAESELTQMGLFLSSKFDIGESFSILASARYDSIDYEVRVPDEPTDIEQNIVTGDDTFLNWSINPSFKINESLSLYGALQEATTYAPLQGGAIVGDQNFGESSLKEVGIKMSAMEGNLFSTLSYYEWDQASFNDITGTSDPYESEGIEFELAYAATESTTIIASFSDRETRRTTSLGYRTMPFGLLDPTGAGNDEIGVALEGGALLNQFANAFGGFTPEGGSPSANPDLIVPGAPQTVVKLFVSNTFNENFGASIGAVWSDSYWTSYDRNIEIDSSTVVNANLWYETEAWKAMLSLENLTEEDYFLGADPNFAANNLLTKAPEDVQMKLTLTVPF
ncbi:TonB-dependent siderophore receptor [Pelagicoccus albus]|uniref:TonB-dependent receptor plug domain-containing protein n=1 Tax=Pelagicoccus albus TaxID=415222 RepID=A0A7X1BBF1_9BACT|nr:TonB-dependent receptor plug domain-containing protein [Pelagicoccus albus]MBC2607875.1 hypothetical protein [Pelagicoccus albus]